MAGFVDYNEIISEITQNGKFYDVNFMKFSPTLEGAGHWGSTRYAHGIPSSGSHPALTPGTAFTNMSGTGSIILPATSPETKHLLTFGATATVACTIMLYDLLVGVADVPLTSGGVKFINSIALPRYTDGVGVQAWIELTTVTAGTAPQVGLHSYTNDAGTSGRSGSVIVLPATITDVRYANSLTLAGADTGVRSVEQMGVSVVGTTGIANLLLIKPLAYLPIAANLWNEKDFVLQYAALPRIYDGACLNIMQLGTATTATTIYGQLRVGYS